MIVNIQIIILFTGKLKNDGIYVENNFNNSSFVGIPFKLVIMRTDI